MPKSGALLASLSPYTSHYRNRKSLMPRQAAEPHLEDGGIYRKWWWPGWYQRRACGASAHVEDDFSPALMDTPFAGIRHQPQLAGNCQ